MGHVPLAHAYTIIIADRNQEDILDQIQNNKKYSAMDRQGAIFTLAWHYQTRPSIHFVDVEHECLGYFEERLFEDSLQAGQAGNKQWGLDVGPHQENWSPYADLPGHRNHGDHEDESESELLVCED
jgi:hypothetical protein